MANTKVTILNNLVSALESLSAVNRCTRSLLPPNEARAQAPYIGVIAGTEVELSQDSTDILYGLTVDLLLIKEGDDIEELIDAIKTKIYSPISIGAKLVRIEGQEPVNLIEDDVYSSARILLYIIYVASKTGF